MPDDTFWKFADPNEFGTYAPIVTELPVLAIANTPVPAWTPPLTVTPEETLENVCVR